MEAGDKSGGPKVGPRSGAHPPLSVSFIYCYYSVCIDVISALLLQCCNYVLQGVFEAGNLRGGEKANNRKTSRPWDSYMEDDQDAGGKIIYLSLTLCLNGDLWGVGWYNFIICAVFNKTEICI